MKFTSTRFGEIEFPEEVIMRFPEGMLGFANDRRYILLEHDREGSPFKWLQSLDHAELAFIVIDPVLVEPKYRFEIDVDTRRVIGTDDPRECAAMCIVNVPHDHPVRMSANLKAPLIINAETRCGRQVILGSQQFAINTPLFQEAVGDGDEPKGDGRRNDQPVMHPQRTAY